MSQQGNSMDQMQRDAVRRMQEMQARAHMPKRPPSSSASVVPPVPTKKETPSKHHKDIPKSKPKEKEPAPLPEAPKKKGFLEDLLKDKERTLLIVLVIILGMEKADTSLILALLYLIM